MQGIPWDSDAVDGGKSSDQVLLDWLVTPGNYHRWATAGTVVGGSTKGSILQEMMLMFIEHGIHTRNVPNISSKINRVEGGFFGACDMLKKAPKGPDGQPIVTAKMTRVCKYFDLLYPIMGEYSQSAMVISLKPVQSLEAESDKLALVVEPTPDGTPISDAVDSLVLMETPASTADSSPAPIRVVDDDTIPEVNVGLVPAPLPELIPAQITAKRRSSTFKPTPVSQSSTKNTKPNHQSGRSATQRPNDEYIDDEELADLFNSELEDDDWLLSQPKQRDLKANKKRASIVNASTKQSKDGYKPGPASKSNRTPHSSSKRSLIASSEPHKKSRRSDTYTLPSIETKYRSRVSSGYERDEHTSQRLVEQDDLVLQIERQELKLRLEKIKSDIEIYKSDAIMTKIKARRRLKRSGVSDTQIDRLLPL
ncbi:hypothetical protein BDEG_27693 [Batrachochytrium dendrobatidis JEL423]|uniref:Uncharacterized protein n=1 Tax=Batrachochytrium dendrobatidis (strain JEL423) TaxID=403673 RepID=A0A177WWM2_BATDL|nr:hypothetical protein BDEG_27693 [Batrachochytrium dendrobatidis JEL423]